MKLVLIAAVTASAFFVGLKSNHAVAATPSAALQCGKQGESCSGSVICCSGLSCISRSGGDPTCEER